MPLERAPADGRSWISDFAIRSPPPAALSGGGDAAPFASYRDDAEVARYQGWGRPYTVEQARAFILGLEGLPPGRPGTWFQFAVCEREVDDLVGDIGLRTTEENATHCELGFTFARAHHGSGYATEAVSAVLAYARDRLEMTRCFAITDGPNASARKLLERSAFELEHELPDSTCVYGRALLVE